MHSSIRRFSKLAFRTAATFAAAGVLIGASVASADPDIGCGPGTQIWRGSKGIPPKVLGATTNGSFGLQTFGITFGTIGCHAGGTVTADARVRAFTAANIDPLARDMARGEGEALASLAHLMGIAEGDRPAFGALVKGHFAELFPSDDVESSEVLATLERVLAADARFAVYVQG